MTTYSRNSTYFTNLNTLLSSLSSPNASYSTGFQTATAGQAPDKVTGLFLCRPGDSQEVCRSCVVYSVKESLNQCPNEKEAVFYYEECILRYSHKNILSTVTYDGFFSLDNKNNISSNQNQIDQFIAVFCFRAKRKRMTHEREPLARDRDDITTAGSLQYDFNAIEAATDKQQISFHRVTSLVKVDLVKFTSGYMSPEYAMYGQFSMKSDVYSFGVLVLEIISGKKNSSLYQMDGTAGNLVTYTWRLWSNGTPLELVDPSFGDNYQTNEITRCIHIALLCVQEDADDRPTMSAIVQMLTTNSIALAVARPPGFFFRNKHEQAERAGPSIDTSTLCSVDEDSITCVAPR
ncbi:hypothetical protein CARUB_v10006953mg [Capsella rubella]|uniref:Gnk2-homologous domain-containing protein n=1 Tax=Capsella rubella TaxID=81985 RepID=R0H1B3_9BRAS|nr:hypothetical protein CARUB_v10006953mg [Capsella rubella]